MAEFIIISIYVLFFLPGFLFVKVKNLYFPNDNNSIVALIQNILEILLWTVIFWILSFVSVWFFIGDVERKTIMDTFVQKILGDFYSHKLFSTLTGNPHLILIGLGILFGASVLLAIIISKVRKNKYIDFLFRRFTKRELYPSVLNRFLHEKLGRPIMVRANHSQYIGILNSAPDKRDDSYITLKNPHMIRKKNGRYLKDRLPLVEEILIKIDDIEQIKAFKKTILKKKKKQQKPSPKK